MTTENNRTSNILAFAISNSVISSYVKFYVKGCPFLTDDLQGSMQLVFREDFYQAQAQCSGFIDIKSRRKSYTIIAYGQIDPAFF